MTRALLILPILALDGCAGPAKAQDSLEADRLLRMEEGIIALGYQITDDRFDEVAAQLTKMAASRQRGTDALNENLAILSDKIYLLTIIISTVAGGGVLGGGAVYQITKPKKEPAGSEA